MNPNTPPPLGPATPNSTSGGTETPQGSMSPPMAKRPRTTSASVFSPVLGANAGQTSTSSQTGTQLNNAAIVNQQQQQQQESQQSGNISTLHTFLYFLSFLDLLNHLLKFFKNECLTMTWTNSFIEN